jgi:hypothetical protein
MDYPNFLAIYQHALQHFPELASAILRAVHTTCTGQKTLRSRAFPSSALPRSPTHCSNRTVGVCAVAIHRHPCARLLRSVKLATRVRARHAE